MFKNKLLIVLTALSVATVMTTGCSKEDNITPISATSLEVKMVTSLQADSKVYFNLTTGEIIPEDDISSTNWDISFFGKDRNIVVAMNSGTEGSGSAGAQLIETGFDDMTVAPDNGYLSGKEATGDYLKWSNYTYSNKPAHAVLPKPGIIIAIRTADGKYSKLQIISLYKGNPNTTTPEFADLATRPDFGYFTFRYSTQKDGSRNF